MTESCANVSEQSRSQGYDFSLTGHRRRGSQSSRYILVDPVLE